MDTQAEAHAGSAEIQRNATYFRENIAKVTTVDGLVQDRRLMTVALGAFGLDDDINNTYYIRKVLSDGTLDETALANRIADKSYFKLAEAFGFGDFDTPNTVLSDFPDKIISAYETRQFEIAVGQANGDMRLALNAQRELAELSVSDKSETTKWYSVMGSEPLRTVFEAALGLPTEFAALDIDKQLDMFQNKAARSFGDDSVAQFSDPEKVDDLIRLFLVRSQVRAGNAGMSSGTIALTLLGR